MSFDIVKARCMVIELMRKVELKDNYTVVRHKDSIIVKWNDGFEIRVDDTTELDNLINKYLEWSSGVKKVPLPTSGGPVWVHCAYSGADWTHEMFPSSKEAFVFLETRRLGANRPSHVVLQDFTQEEYEAVCKMLWTPQNFLLINGILHGGMRATRKYFADVVFHCGTGGDL